MLINEQIIYELDETLKLLNGLQNNSHIRTKICQHTYICLRFSLVESN